MKPRAGLSGQGGVGGRGEFELPITRLTSERKSARLPFVMTTAVAPEVRRYIARKPSGSFIHARDLVDRFGSRGGVDVALSRLATSDPSLTRVRHGLYWKSPVSRFGKSRPRPLEVALAVAGAEREGVGPAGWTALRALGLTTQVPSVDEVAVLGPAPTRVPGTIYRSRSNPARSSLRFHEIAALEALRFVSEYDSPERRIVTEKVCDLTERGAIRWKRLREAAAKESPPVRRAVARIDAALAERPTAA